MEVFRSTVSSLYLYQGNSAQMKCSLEVLDFKYGTFNIYIYKEIARLCLLWIYYPCSFFFPLWPSFLDIHYDCRNKPGKKCWMLNPFKVNDNERSIFYFLFSLTVFQVLQLLLIVRQHGYKILSVSETKFHLIHGFHGIFEWYPWILDDACAQTANPRGKGRSVI